jgi:hypothetical protein
MKINKAGENRRIYKIQTHLVNITEYFNRVFKGY